MAVDLASFVRDVPDFPKPGILFRDITPLLANAAAFAAMIETMASQLASLEASSRPVNKLVGIEARGFIFASALALRAHKGFVPIRKPGKLPRKTHSRQFKLEYGVDELHLHVGDLLSTDNVVIVDDVLATGGTARTAAELVEMTGARVAGLVFAIELTGLQGRKKLTGLPMESVLRY